ncbi:hypothetical protein [Rhodoferax ferrireducens]|uniref:hypothetical protein n=1 Tax=Rhodoferax ferrireducens TaxID=192843 RepID=UPI003BB567F0
MIHQTTSAVSQPDRIKTLLSRAGAPSAPAMTEELLPFTVRLVRDEDDLSKAVQIRHSAYARHLPDFAETLKSAETADAENGVVVLLAESKLDGSPLGTMRIQTNQFKPLCLEQSVELPGWLKTLRLAEATRLGVTNERGGRLVTTVLFKAYYQYCKQIGIEWMVIAGRAPIDRQYARLLFEDVFPGVGFIPLLHAGNLPHRVMSSNVDTAEDRWAAAKHPLFDFAFRTNHPDIQLGGQRRPYVPRMAMSAFPAHGATFPM